MDGNWNMKLDLGAIYQGNGRCQFLVWAPWAHQVEVHLLGPHDRYFPLFPIDRGYHQAIVEEVRPGEAYLFRLHGREEYPDPASRFQPSGVLGPSHIMDPHFDWDDQPWAGLRLEDYLIYELHVGTFSAEGTFAGVIEHLDELKDLGITAIEIMPVAQFPGARNWGYDGVYPFAVQNSYGGYMELKRLVNACHQKGLAAILDVVYNHFGPEGNFCSKYGPYYTSRYKTAWGDALNFDEPQSDEVRRFFLENARYWITEFHFDALRLDAVHTILDFSPEPFLKQLAAVVHKQAEFHNRRVYVIAESDSNDVRLVKLPVQGGYGMDALWSDDFHHALHCLLTGERSGYYQDFGKLRDLGTALQEGFVYSSRYSDFRQRCHGSIAKEVPGKHYVICSQNHDQVGNRARGERLCQLAPLASCKLAAGMVLLSPYIPLLFMGEEYGETAPFPYFINHSDPKLVEAVRQGRKQEFADFSWKAEIPDPQSQDTFINARLHHELRTEGEHKVILEFYRELIRHRKNIPALAALSKDNLQVITYEDPRLLFFHRWAEGSAIFGVFNFGEAPSSVFLPIPEGEWRKLMDSEDRQWSGEGSAIQTSLSSKGGLSISLGPRSMVLFQRSSS
jgi:maltooligosyltrehalose trehalohydrolase